MATKFDKKDFRKAISKGIKNKLLKDGDLDTGKTPIYNLREEWFDAECPVCRKHSIEKINLGI